MDAWLLLAALHAAMVIAAATIVERLLRTRSPHARLTFWRMVIVCAMAPPVAVTMLPADARLAIPVAASLHARVAASTGVVAAALTPLRGLVAAIVAAGIALRLMWLACGAWRLRRWRLTAQPWPSDAAAERLQADLAPAARLALHPQVTQPATFGWRRPIVLLPPALLSLAPDARIAVIAHELQHASRGDWPWIVAEEIVRTVCWCHPAVRWALAQVVLCREHLVDDAVVARVPSRAAYIEALLLFAAEHASAVPVLRFTQRSELVRRVRHLMDAGPRHSRRTTVVRTALATLAVLMVTWASAAAVGRQSAEATAPVPAGGAVMPRVVYQVRPGYTPQALAAKVQGDVLLDAVIGTDGTVESARVTKSLPLLDDAAIAAAKQWRFSPSRLDGRPVRVAVALQFRFTLR